MNRMTSMGLFSFALISLGLVYIALIIGLAVFLFYPLDSTNMGPSYEGWYYALFGLFSLFILAPKAIRYLYNEIVESNQK